MQFDIVPTHVTAALLRGAFPRGLSCMLRCQEICHSSLSQGIAIIQPPVSVSAVPSPPSSVLSLLHAHFLMDVQDSIQSQIISLDFFPLSRLGTKVLN